MRPARARDKPEERREATLRDYLEAQRRHFLAGCTACGDCFDACPIVPLTPLREASGEPVIRGVLDILRGDETPPADAVSWTEACTRCGVCIERCPEGLNPRKMLGLAEGLAHEAMGAQAGGSMFRLLARNIHLMSGLQLDRQSIDAFQAPPRGEADVVFFLGCNLMSTPHIILNVMDLLSALGLDYRVAGGTGYCCGIIHHVGGELERAGKVAESLYSKLAAMRPRRVLTWCPSCEIHLGETVAGFQQPDFEMQHLTTFLVEQLGTLKERMSTPIERRIALHSHGGLPRITDNVRRLLAAVPDLETIELDDGGELGYSCNLGGMLRVPSLQTEVQSNVTQEAHKAGAEEIVDLYHGCHRLLWDGEDGLKVRNFTDVLVEALGLPAHEDRLQAYRAMPGIDQVLSATRDLMEENWIDPADAERLLRGLFQQ